MPNLEAGLAHMERLVQVVEVAVRTAKDTFGTTGGKVLPPCPALPAPLAKLRKQHRLMKTAHRDLSRIIRSGGRCTGALRKVWDQQIIPDHPTQRVAVLTQLYDQSHREWVSEWLNLISSERVESAAARSLVELVGVRYTDALSSCCCCCCGT